MSFDTEELKNREQEQLNGNPREEHSTLYLFENSLVSGKAISLCAPIKTSTKSIICYPHLLDVGGSNKLRILFWGLSPRVEGPCSPTGLKLKIVQVLSKTA